MMTRKNPGLAALLAPHAWIRTAALVAGLICPLLAHANTVTRVVPSARQAQPNQPFSITLGFDNPATVACGVMVDWGDGQTERLRVGEGQQVLPPFVLTHTYTTQGEYKVRITGEAIIRGLRSVMPCDVRREGTVSVMEPAEAARQATARAAAESEKREREAAQKAEAAARASAEAEERAKREAAATAAMAATLAKASIKTCDQFVAAFKERYEYANDWPSVACQPGTDSESALVLRVSNPARRGGSAVATLSYQPQNETVVYQGGSGSATVLRASNFVDVKEPVDMNAPDEIKFKYLPLAQKKLVCQKITGVNKQLVREHTFRISAGFEAAEIAANGNWEWEIVESAQGCDLRIDVAGVYNGNSHRKTVRCPVGTIVKRSDSNYSVVNMFHISYCR